MPAPALLCAALNFAMVCNLSSSPVICKHEILTLKISCTSQEQERLVNPHRELLRWWGNLGECNNHQDSPPSALWEQLDWPGWSAGHAKQAQNTSHVQSSLLGQWPWPVLAGCSGIQLKSGCAACPRQGTGTATLKLKGSTPGAEHLLKQAGIATT